MNKDKIEWKSFALGVLIASAVVVCGAVVFLVLLAYQIFNL